MYPIKRKAYVFSIFKSFKARVELESGKKIKCLRIDVQVKNLITSFNKKVSRGNSRWHILPNKMEWQSG